MPAYIPEGCKTFNLICARDQDGHVLLGRKTRGFGEGQLVLPGGKLTAWGWPVATVLDLQARDAYREFSEETGDSSMNPQEFTSAGALYVEANPPKYIALFRIATNGIVPPGSDEVTDFSYYADVPYDKTPEDYQHWLPGVLAGKFVIAHFLPEETRIYEA